MSEECIFLAEVREFKATNLTSRNRFKDKLRLVCEFDDKKFKTKKELIGGGDVQWKFSWKHEYRIFSYKYLEEKLLKITCLRSKTEVYGRASVDLYTIATGPEEHNLPLLDFENKVVGRLNFIVEMPQVANIAVIFKQVKLKNLKPVGANRECNPYLKYTYSKLWPLVLENRAKATYSTTQYNTTDPAWTDLPEVRFHASLKELLHESIVLHVTHQGKVTNTTLGRCNLLFRTLVDNGKTFKDEDLISFKGPLKVEDAEIEGVLVFKFLPRFAQMKPLNIVKKAIHTEKGIFDALPLLPALPKPTIPIINSEQGNLPEVPKNSLTTKPTDSPGRKRAQTVAARASQNWSAEEEEKEVEKLQNSNKKEEEKIVDAPKSKFVSVAVTEDLISFTPPTLRRQRSASTSMAINPFAPPSQPATLFPLQPPQVQTVPQFGSTVPLQSYPQQPSFNPFAPNAVVGPQGFGYPQVYPQQQQQQQPVQQFAQPSFNPFAPPVTNTPFAQQQNSPFNF